MSKGCVLVVDDDEDIRGFLTDALELERYTVVEASQGREALQVLDRQPIDLILLDMKMPIMDGWTFAVEYKTRPGPHAPIVVMTAAANPSERAREVQARCAVAKPFELAVLLHTVECAVDPGCALVE